MLVLWLGAQFVAGWKFANGVTYPVVGSAMFNGPPAAGSDDFLVPRVFITTASGTRIELDQHDFHLEPFEWRRWIKRHLEDVNDAHAATFARQLADLVDLDGGDAVASIEVWRVPAFVDDPAGGTLIRRVVL
jgi:hypothetical protein